MGIASGFNITLRFKPSFTAVKELGSKQSSVKWSLHKQEFVVGVLPCPLHLLYPLLLLYQYLTVDDKEGGVVTLLNVSLSIGKSFLSSTFIMEIVPSDSRVKKSFQRGERAKATDSTGRGKVTL